MIITYGLRGNIN